MTGVGKGWVVGLAASLALAGCSSASNPLAGARAGGPRSASEQHLADQTSRFNETVWTGAGLGALLGAGIGAASSKNRLEGAAVGGVAGGALGAGAGWYVASQNEQYATREQATAAKIQSAQKEAASYQDLARLSQQVAAENRAKLADLDRRYRSGQITAAQYRAEAENARQDQQNLDNSLRYSQELQSKLQQDMGNYPNAAPQLASARSKIDASSRQIASARNELSRALSAVPEA